MLDTDEHQESLVYRAAQSCCGGHRAATGRRASPDERALFCGDRPLYRGPDQGILGAEWWATRIRPADNRPAGAINRGPAAAGAVVRAEPAGAAPRESTPV